MKANTQEASVGRKGKIALFRRPTTWGEGGLATKSQLPTAHQGQELLKGSFRGVQVEAGGYMQKEHSSSDSHLEIDHLVV